MSKPRTVAGAFLGGILGYSAVPLLEFLGLPFLENAPAWLAIIGAIHGGIVATFGAKYWVALGNDAGDLIDDQPRNDNSRMDSGSKD